MTTAKIRQHGGRCVLPGGSIRATRASLLALVLTLSTLSPIVAGTRAAQASTGGAASLISVNVDGEAGIGYSGRRPGISRDGRFVTFSSLAPDLGPGGHPSGAVFVRDTAKGRTELVSVSSDEVPANGASGGSDISGDGRFIAFHSVATNLAPDDSNGVADVFLRDRWQGTTVMVSRALDGKSGNSRSLFPTISHNGRYVIFGSDATNLVEGHSNAPRQEVYLYDTANGSMEVVSQAVDGLSNADSRADAISAGGRYIAFKSSASNLVDNDTNGRADIFVRDRKTATTKRVSISSSGEQANNWPGQGNADITAGGGAVVFTSRASNLVPGDTNGEEDIFVHHLDTSTTVRVNLTNAGAETGGAFMPAISGAGRFVTFRSLSTNYDPGDTTPTINIYLRDRVLDVTQLVSNGLDGAEPDGYSQSSNLSPDGRWVVFESGATNLTAETDTNANLDMFLVDRAPALAVRASPPLIAAHGITGVAGDMDPALDIARDVIPTLPPSSFSIDTGETSSIWLNGRYLAARARDLVESSGRRVAVLGHSKGGLDARAAMWEDPSAFVSLGMLGSPNGGSQGADKLCAVLRRVGVFPPGTEQFGPCRGPGDGLYTLQTAYMRHFNNIVRDRTAHNHWVVAGDCGGLACGVGNSFLAQGCDLGGDGTVCVESAFARARNFSFPGQTPGGKHLALDPLFDNDHSRLRSDPCPVSRLFAEMYGKFNVGNPWIDGGDCSDLESSASVAAAPSGGNEDPVSAQAGIDAEQTVAGFVASPLNPVTVSLDSEDGNVAQAEVYTADTVGVTVTVLDSAGNPVSDVAVDEDQHHGVRSILVRHSELAPFEYSLRIEVDRSAQVGVITSVASDGFNVQAEVEAAGGGSAEVSVLLPGTSAVEGPMYEVGATFHGSNAPGTVALNAEGFTEEGYRFSAMVPLPRGELIQVDIDLKGPRQRALRDSIVLSDETGLIRTVEGDMLIDRDGDGVQEIVRIDVGVDVAVGGEFQLAVDLHASDGTFLMSAGGRANLVAGAGSIPVDVPVEGLLVSGRDGPYDVVNAVLSHGSESQAFAHERADVGVTSALSSGDFELKHPAIGRPSVEGIDEEGDGLYDVLRFEALAWVPRAGDYYLESLLGTPGGTIADGHSAIARLPAGHSLMTIEFGGWAVEQYGSGEYTLSDLSLTSLSNVEEVGHGPPAFIEANLEEWKQPCLIEDVLDNETDTERTVSDVECVAANLVAEAKLP